MKNKGMRIYLLTLFIISLLTPRVLFLWPVFILFVFTLPLHSLIIGIIAGRDIKARWFWPVFSALLLAAAYFFSFTHITMSDDSQNLFLYCIRRVMEAITVMGNVTADTSSADISSDRGITVDVSSFQGFGSPPNLFIPILSSPLISIISMLISAAITSCIQKKHDKSGN